MKRIIIIALLAIGLSAAAKAQTIDTAFHVMTAVKIQPFKANFNDAVNVSYLGIRVINDNLQNSAVLYWALMDGTGNIYYSGNATITGSSYTAYATGTNLYPFTFMRSVYPQIIFQ